MAKLSCKFQHKVEGKTSIFRVWGEKNWSSPLDYCFCWCLRKQRWGKRARVPPQARRASNCLTHQWISQRRATHFPPLICFNYSSHKPSSLLQVMTIWNLLFVLKYKFRPLPNVHYCFNPKHWNSSLANIVHLVTPHKCGKSQSSRLKK